MATAEAKPTYKMFYSQEKSISKRKYVTSH